MRIWRSIDAVARTGSLRQAAERLHITASALQRRLDDVEADLGTPLFERSATGMRLSVAGELFLGWIRAQDSALEQVRSRIEDLAGLRRGHVRIAASQALALSFLPDEIAAFRALYPGVTFQVSIRDHAAALHELAAFETELALIFRPPPNADWQPLAQIGQRIVAIMAPSHPLAARATVLLRDCLPWPVALPDRSLGARQILEERMAGHSARLRVVLESNSFELLRHSVRDGRTLTFQIETGAPARDDPAYAVRPLDEANLAHGPLVLGQLRGRALPVAAARFAERLAARLDAARDDRAFSS
ncbi:LysR substrate-binding domain-containing protein [Roseomonas sp. NAR14]|uniref:LysR substrate-binding domain-containing protein n=1 Tax=Roseomonas acroporae TaxID=2937791 RepID=A0A9X1YAM5_9PROT|nr:LysR substrate-binding domain-containing protein [Roseomonas acroporae]MCK8785918.1 LysR substrate-binding domain-containing protein [Roseomonas acroporae]